MLDHRTLESSDAKIISKFPQSEEELFYMFPKAEYPLQPEILLKEAGKRFYPTVVISGDRLAGYGNFIHAEHGDSCSIGNVVVNPEIRQKGVASYLVETLLTIAFDQLKVRFVRISCFNANTPGLLLYRKLGFTPVDMEVRLTRNEQRVAVIHMHKYAG
ncbi:MAG: GNAT family N-acetyltransferase [Desulfobacteraceae bacterium]|nr:GNAT family N-acetyltransferase [Desulfobacteraceae bacterium]